MNISSLKQYIDTNGNKFKSYRHLCEVLEIKPKGGDSKKAQMKEIERYIKLSKGKGYRLIIDEVYDKPLQKEDGRQNKYNQLVQLLLTDYFAKSNKQVLELTLNDMLRLVHLVNHNYSLASNNVPKFSEYLGIEEQITYDHFSLAHSRFKNNIETVLSNLSDMHLVNVHKDAVFISDLNNKKRVANEDEIELFEQAGEEALSEIFEDNSISKRKKSNVRYTKYWNKYKTISSNKFKKLMKEEFGKSIKSTYIGYRIVINRKAIKKAHSELLIEYLDEVKRKQYLDEVETIVLNDLVKKAIDRHKESQDMSNDIKMRIRRYRTLFGYVEGNKKIIELTHSQNAINLAHEFDKKKERELNIDEVEAIEKIFE